MNKILAFGLLLLFPIQLLAEEATTPDSIPAPVDELDMFQVIAPLLMVIALIFVLTWVVKKINPGLPKMGQDIKILSTTPLSSQAKLCLIRAGGKDILIGVTGNTISHLQTFDEPVVPEKEKENPADFAHQFRRLLSRNKTG